MPDPSPDIAWITSLLAEAGDVAMRHFRAGVEVRRKADHSPVTDADVEAERVLVAGILARWPGDAVFAEESGHTPGSSGYTWHVDPIDGTSSFTEGLAHWGPTIARVRDDGPVESRVVLAGTALPRLQERYVVTDTHAWAQGEPLEAPTGRWPARVVYLPSGFHRGARLAVAAKGRCVGGTAAHLALVARGAASAVIVGPRWRLWDTAAGLALIWRVGGRAARLSDGSPLDPFRDEGVPFVAGFPGIIDEVLRPGALTVMAPGAQDGGPER